MPKIKINDINLYYEIHGKGQPIVFISGFVADHTNWGTVFSDFAKNYQVITFDNRGTGQSDAPDYPYTIEMMAKDVVDLCQSFGLNSVHCVGNSMGGSIVQMLAYKYPAFTKTATICNSAIKFGTKAGLMVETNTALRQANVPLEICLKKTLCELFSANFLSQPGMVDALLNLLTNNPYPITDQGYFSQLNAIGTFDSKDWVSKITVPSLVIYSNEDQFVDIDTSITLANAIPNAKNFCFDKAGHLPHIEQPDLFIKVVNNFIKELSL